MTDKPYEPTFFERNMAKNTIYTKESHPYEFKIRVNHPEIQPFFKDYKKMIGEPECFPISDDERLGFERLVLCGYYPIQLKRA